MTLKETCQLFEAQEIEVDGIKYNMEDFDMSGELLNKNLNNVETEVDLFGNKIDKLSMKDRIGFMPISIWQPDWTKVKELKKIVGDTGQTRELKDNKVAGLPGMTAGASIFNPHLAQMILSAYCPQEAKIYDPFAGGGTRGLIAAAMGHIYYGIELRQEEVDRIKVQQSALDKKFYIMCGDSTQDHKKVNFFDFCYTCPPYYNLEVYSDRTDDLSNAKTYSDFMNMIGLSLSWVYSGLKPGAIAVWVVGNFRNKAGGLTHFSGDVIRKAKEVGFKLHDELIFWGASGCAAQRCGQFEANRKSVRVHEYVIILKKDK